MDIREFIPCSMAWQGNFEQWVTDPVHIRPIAHAIWDPHFGQPAEGDFLLMFKPFSWSCSFLSGFCFYIFLFFILLNNQFIIQIYQK